MFCDIVGSTALSGRLDPEDLRSVVRDYQAACAEVIRRFDGHIAQYLGDGLLVYFGHPVAHEDDAQRAAAAALGIVDAVSRRDLAVRIGVHTGPVVIGDVGGETRLERLALGETPNIAARLQSIAAPNTILVSAATERLIRDGFVCREIGAQALKGVDTPVSTFEVLEGAPVQSRTDVDHSRVLPELTGRAEEFALLLERWRRARGGGGQVVLISGEPGIGKSRLVQALRQHSPTTDGSRLECRCSSYHQHSAFHPLIDLLERGFGFASGDSDETRFRKLEDGLGPFIADVREAVPIYAALLSVPTAERYALLELTPQRQKEKTLETVLSVLLAMAGREPVVFVVEDVHWADPSMLELLALVVEQAANARLLVVLTFRPEFRSPWPSRPHLTHITLDRLAPDETVAMATRVAGGKRLPAELILELVRKTDGVPLFVEELTKTVLESGVLRDSGDTWSLDVPLTSLAVPSSLQDSLMARLDRLDETRTVAQLAAVLGREFHYEMLKVVSELDDGTLQAALARLVDSELVYQRGLPPRASYMFKHALIQEAAYTSLLKSTRQQRHGRIAAVIERDFPATAETQPELLAHHCAHAGLAAAAIGWWHRAARSAMQRWANAEAVAHIRAALELLGGLPDDHARRKQELTLQIDLAAALTVLFGWAASEIETTLQRARVLAEEVGDPSEVSTAIHGLWAFYLVRGEMRKSLEAAQTFMTFAEATADRKILQDAHRAVGVASMSVGRFQVALDHFAEALARYDPERDVSDVFRYGADTAIVCWGFTAMTRWIIGDLDQAVIAMRHTLETAEGIGHPFVTAFGLYSATYVTYWRRDPDAWDWSKRWVALNAEQRFDMWVTYAASVVGHQLYDQGRAAEGLAEAERGLALRRALGTGQSEPYALLLLAEMQRGAGHVDEALVTIDKALARIEEWGERMWEVEALRVRGEVLLARGSAHEAEAEAILRRAIDVARGQAARSWELRAATSLARLLARTARKTEGREILTEIYEWFTEGRQTGDLRAAEALLATL